MNLADYIRDVADFPKPGILFKDITPLLANPVAFTHAIDLLTEHYRRHAIDSIAAAEARGFLLAAPLAVALNKPLIPLRKPGKLPYETISIKYDLEYGSNELQMHTDSVKPGDKVLLVDDLLATGGTIHAACELVEKAGGTVAGLGFLIELAFLDGRAKLPGREIFSILTF